MHYILIVFLFAVWRHLHDTFGMKRTQTDLTFVSLASISLFLATFASPAAQAGYPKWKKNLPPYSSAANESGRWLRTVLHVHSVFSHDACDKKGIKGGKPNQKCLNDLRNAFCKTHIDVAFITEHKDRLADFSLPDSLHLRAGDEPILMNGEIIGSIQHCPDGHKIRVYPGSENSLMALGQLRHPEPIDGDLRKAYAGVSERVASGLKATGALLAINHPEATTIEQLRLLEPHAIEIYNTHANLKRITDGSKTKLVKSAAKLLTFLSNPFLKSDLYFLSFFKEDHHALTKWAQLSMDRHVTGVFGADAHQNLSPLKMWDGERVDSFRRNFRWYSNLIWVESKDPTREEILKSIEDGKSLAVFELFGTADGFAFESTGTTLPTRLTVRAPMVRDWRPPLRRPVITLRILRATENGWVEVARNSAQATLETTIDLPGSYRAEARIKPDHLRPYLPTARHLIKEYPWVYSNAVRLSE